MGKPARPHTQAYQLTQQKNPHSFTIFCKTFGAFQKTHYLCITLRNGDSLAQLVEHHTFNVGVLCSSPKRITKLRFIDTLYEPFFVHFDENLSAVPPAVTPRCLRFWKKSNLFGLILWKLLKFVITLHLQPALKPRLWVEGGMQT